MSAYPGYPARVTLNPNQEIWIYHSSVRLGAQVLIDGNTGGAAIEIKSGNFEQVAALSATDAVSDYIKPGCHYNYAVPRDQNNNRYRYTRIRCEAQIVVTFNPSHPDDILKHVARSGD